MVDIIVTIVMYKYTNNLWIIIRVAVGMGIPMGIPIGPTCG